MKSSKHNLWMLGLALWLAVLTGCSSKETKPESGEIEATLTQGDEDLPNADEVGSILHRELPLAAHMCDEIVRHLGEREVAHREPALLDEVEQKFERALVRFGTYQKACRRRSDFSHIILRLPFPTGAYQCD